MAIFSIAKIVSSATKTSSYQMEKVLKISYQMILKYIAMVVAFFMDFKILNNKNNYIDVQQFNEKYYLTNCEIFVNEKYLLDFFHFYNWAFLMQKYRNKSSIPISIFISKSPPT
jgi:hypothetical protein